MGGRLQDIDLLRGYAVLLVVFLHLNLLDPYRNPFFQGVLACTDMGVGVDLFFIISGFVICRALGELWAVASAEDARRLRDVPLVFYRKRFLRLWPAAALWLVLNVVLAGLFDNPKLWPPVGLVAAKAVFGFVYLYNFQEVTNPSVLGYFWSLSVEWQFYLILPVFLLLVRGDGWRIGLLLAVLALSVWARPGGGLWTFFRFDGIVFGILLYVLIERLAVALPRYRSVAHPSGRQLVTLILLAAIIMVPPSMADRRLGYLFANAVGTMLVALAAADRGSIGTFGMAPLVRWLGSRSYSIYLVHIPMVLSVLSLYHVALTSAWHPQPLPYPICWYYAATIPLIAAAAELTYRFVEVPSHRASRAITQQADAGAVGS